MSDKPALNKNRKKLYDIMEHQETPVSVSDIAARVKDEMDQATVYRGLRYLEEQGLIQSFTFDCHKEGILKYYTKRENHHHFLHCEKCHSFIPVEECKAELLNSIEKQYGVEIRSHTVTYLGTCTACLKADK